jgi:hypothetical protein
MNLFVANLGADVTDSILEAAFQPFGRILSAKVMLDIRTGKSRGFGFVLFDNPASARAARVALHGQLVGREQNISVYDAISTGVNAINPTTKVHVRNVPRELPTEALQKHFAQFGTLSRLFIRNDDVRDSSTAPLENADVVVVTLEYSTPEEAQEAVRRIHNTNPWPGMKVPLLAKTSETGQMRHERQRRRAVQPGLNQQQTHPHEARLPALPPYNPLMASPIAPMAPPMPAQIAPPISQPMPTHPQMAAPMTFCLQPTMPMYQQPVPSVQPVMMWTTSQPFLVPMTTMAPEPTMMGMHQIQTRVAMPPHDISHS